MVLGGPGGVFLLSVSDRKPIWLCTGGRAGHNRLLEASQLEQEIARSESKRSVMELLRGNKITNMERLRLSRAQGKGPTRVQAIVFRITVHQV